jgi:hypothetical protein
MTPDIEQAVAAFNEWRSTRVTRGHTPAYLKALATALVGHYPSSQICERLSVNTSALKEWAEKQAQPAQFVTLDHSSSAEPATPGLTLKLTCNGIDLHLSGELNPSLSWQ